jgi:hypothetical protein
MISPAEATRHGSIDLRAFKSLVERRLPHDSPLYRVIVSEKDELPVDSFVSKSEVWLKLMDISFPPL